MAYLWIQNALNLFWIGKYFEKNDFSIVIALLFMVNYINIIFFRNR